MSVYDRLSVEVLFAELRGTDARERLQGALDAAGANGWIIGAPMPDPGDPSRNGFEVTPPIGIPPLGVAEGWKLAHAVANGSGGDVEPVFAGDVPLPPPEQPDAAFAFSDPDDALPPPPINWQLELLAGIELPAVDDIEVAQPDTGYTDHPELGGVIDTNAASSFLPGETSARDPLQRGLLLQPGHGTATASVLAARQGTTSPRSDTGEMVDLVGAAAGAKVIPLRVTTTVIILGWQRRLAQAIEAGVERKARVISISLGGLGGSRLERACRLAESRGVIVVCAAGNYYPAVVAPASYPSVVAVAATGPTGEPWRYSAHGPEVTIAAPGHRVWVAAWDDAGRAIARLGSGTSFGTAYVAGLAARWIARHKARLDASATTPARFRAALASAIAKLLPEGYGAGLLDPAKLLSNPLTDPAPADRAFSASEVERSPLQREEAFHRQLAALADEGDAWRNSSPPLRARRGALRVEQGRDAAGVARGPEEQRSAPSVAYVADGTEVTIRVNLRIRVTLERPS